MRSDGASRRLGPPSVPLPGGPRQSLPGWSAPWRRPIALTPELTRTVLDAYAESDRALEAACAMGLEALGYFGGAPA